jgi:non-specific serine/threonine protein kinase
VGGVGKTRLALHLAADLQRSFADGVWLTELSALRSAELLARTVAASLGLPDEAAGDPVDAQPAPRHPSPKRLATLPYL